jgi:hypothetical protein
VRLYVRSPVLPPAHRDAVLHLKRRSVATFTTTAALLLAFLSVPWTVNQTILGHAIFSDGSRASSGPQ